MFLLGNNLLGLKDGKFSCKGFLGWLCWQDRGYTAYYIVYPHNVDQKQGSHFYSYLYFLFLTSIFIFIRILFNPRFQSCLWSNPIPSPEGKQLFLQSSCVPRVLLPWNPGWPWFSDWSVLFLTKFDLINVTMLKDCSINDKL